ncbi:MAG: DMT family transporter [Candidatus Rokubacteria bacterium]|nr:DMT family transporter [Candidatus Rokubacteria bacterium]
MRERQEGIAFLATVVVAWGLTWPVNKLVLAAVPPLWAVTLRSMIAAVVLFALALAVGRLIIPPRADVPVLLSITLLHMVGFTVLTSFGLAVVPAGRSVVLAYTTPLWVTPGARLFLGEPLTARRAVGVLIGLAGLAVLFNPFAFDWTSREAVVGNAAILGGAFLWAGSIIHIRGHRWRATPFQLLPWELLLATVILLPLSLTLEGAPAWAWTPALIALLAYGGIPGTGLPYWAIAMATRRLPAVTISLGLLATPAFSVVVATLWLGEPLTASLVIAIVLILGGICWDMGGSGRPPSPPRSGPGMNPGPPRVPSSPRARAG